MTKKYLKQWFSSIPLCKYLQVLIVKIVSEFFKNQGTGNLIF